MPPKAKPATRGIKKSTSRSKSKKAASTSTDKTTALIAEATTTPPTPPPIPDDPNAPIFFWKPTQPNGYLSQWYTSPFTINSSTYSTTEMYMMVSKARLFGDEATAKQMLATTDPKAHKRLGRKVAPFDAEVWDREKMRIVEEGNWEKFVNSENAGVLRGWLWETGERELVEASPMDRIWGIGFGEKNAEANRHRWGKNLLGKALMNVRTRLREEEGKKKEGKKEGGKKEAE